MLGAGAWRHNGTTANADSVDSDGMQFSTLHDAVDAGDLARVQTLVAAGADIEEGEYSSSNLYEKQTPLIRAAATTNLATAARLLSSARLRASPP